MATAEQILASKPKREKFKTQEEFEADVTLCTAQKEKATALELACGVNVTPAAVAQLVAVLDAGVVEEGWPGGM